MLSLFLFLHLCYAPFRKFLSLTVLRTLILTCSCCCTFLKIHVRKTVTSCTDHKWVDWNELLTWCFVVTACVHGTVRLRCELSLDTPFRLKLWSGFFFFLVQLQHFINTIWNGIWVCHWQCCLMSSSSSSSSWPLYVLEFCFKILRCYCTSPLKVFPFIKMMVSIYCVNTGVILNVNLSPYWMKLGLQTA